MAFCTGNKVDEVRIEPGVRVGTLHTALVTSSDRTSYRVTYVSPDCVTKIVVKKIKRK